MIFLDNEASALTGFPIEVGFARVLPDRSIISLAALIRHDPWLDRVDLWDGRAEAIHKISRANVMEFGQPVTEVASWLNQELAGHRVVIDSPLDRHWVNQLMAAAHMERRFDFVDVGQAFAGPEIDEMAYHVLSKDLSRRRPHRAAEDARQWAEIYAGSLGYDWPVRELLLPMNETG